jgi:hypothetical protein
MLMTGKEVGTDQLLAMGGDAVAGSLRRAAGTRPTTRLKVLLPSQ